MGGGLSSLACRLLAAHMFCSAQLTKSRSRLENTMFLLAVVTIACVMVESELIWSEIQRQPADADALALSTGFLVLKCALSAATLALVAALALRYRTVLVKDASFLSYLLKCFLDAH